MSASVRILDEDPIDLKDACKLVGWSPITGYRNCRRGLEHLRSAPRGGKILTSRAAIARFLANVNGIDLTAPEGGTAGPAFSRQRQHEINRAEATLQRMKV
jgi:hypothetical protein